jgi:hypothetical protein
MGVTRRFTVALGIAVAISAVFGGPFSPPTVSAVVGLSMMPVGGQESTGDLAKVASVKDGATGRLPRTPAGRPDLQGIWTNSTSTPLERPASFGDKEFFTEDEAREFAKQRLDRFKNQPSNVHYDDYLWLGNPDRATKAPTSLRTSVIVDPRDGRLPPLTAEAQKRVKERTIPVSERMPADGPEQRTALERCIMWPHQGPPMLPSGIGPAVDYNTNLQIVQTPDRLLMLQEMIHDARIIPVDGRPHLPRPIRQWFGDSRGRWEGDTLVVETSNFTDKYYFIRRTGSPSLDAIHARGTQSALRVVERFTLTSSDTIRYQFTVDDPTTWTKPWSGELTMWRTQGPLYEYGCHEGNYGLVNILRNERYLEKMD